MRFVLVICANFAVTMVFYLLMTTMALYAVDRFGAAGPLAGFAASSFIIGAIVGRVVAAKFLDFVGRRRFLVASFVALIVISALYPPTDSLWLLFIVRAAHGIAFGFASTTTSSAVVGLIPADRRGEGLGYYGIAATVSTALAPFAAILLVDNLGYDALFAFSAGCSAAGLLVALLLRLPEREATLEEIANKWRLRVWDVLDPKALPIALLMFVAGIGFSGILTFLSPFAQNLGLLPAVGIFFVVYSITVLISRLFMGRLQDRKGDNFVVCPALVAMAIGLVIVAIAQDGFELALAGVLFGFGFGTLLPSAQTIAVTMAEEHRVGVATATYFLLMDAGVGFGPLLLGALIAASDYRTMYMALAAMMLACIVLYYFVHGRRLARRGLSATVPPR